MKPEDIPPARGINVIIGVCLLALSLIPLLPIARTLQYDGFGDIPDWPPLFFGFAAVGFPMVFLGARLLFSRQRVGAEVAFEDGGFVQEVRLFLRRDRRHRVQWVDIEEIKLVDAPRGGDVLAFRLTHAAAVREGLIQPTTHENASKQLVRREISLPLKLCGVSIDEAVSRFKASAEQAGAVLVAKASFNAVIYARKIWSVEWRS